jgi:flagellar hook-associated protein 1 FlgK
MGGLFAALNATATSLDAYQDALNVTQNNVGNASTPGYAAQNVLFNPVQFDPADGEVGGVEFGGTASTRNESAEESVQEQQSALGSAQTQVQTLTALQPTIGISTTSGISGSLTQFFSSFSALSENPNDATDQQQAIVQAQNISAAFQDAASAVAEAGEGANQQISSTVSTINNLAANIAQLNQSQSQSSPPDPNTDASLHSDLETLSQYVNFTSSFSAQGTVTVAIDGQTPLVVGSTSYAIQSGAAPTSATAQFPEGVPAQQILDSNGQDITAQITGGQLNGLLQFRNTTVAGLQGDQNQQGSLNQLAAGFAGRVNTLLTSGESSAGPPAVAGVPLFQFNTADPTGIAGSLSVTAITGSQIASISPGPPYSANGVAQQIGNLGNSTTPADLIDGQTFTAFYAQTAAGIGQQLSDATTNQTQYTQTVAQAQSVRSSLSGVSLDQEAVQLTAFQASYEATSKLVGILASLTQSTIDIIQS